MARLIIQNDGNSDRIESVDRAETIIGRLPSCHLHLTIDDHVSRAHARITRDEAGYWIENISTTNNTVLNGRNVNARVLLRDGDRFEIWKYRLRFEDDPVGPQSPPRFKIDSRFDADAVIPGTLSDPELSAVLRLAQFACVKSLRKAELLENVGVLLKSVFPATQTIALLMRQSSERGGLRVEAIFPSDGRIEALEPDPHIAMECMNTRKELLCRDLEEDPYITVEIPFYAAACAPLISDGNTAFGVIWLASSEKSFVAREVGLLCWTARMIGAALACARTHDAAIANAMQSGDNKIAQQIQKEFLPRDRPQVNGYGFFHHYVPAQSVGGDYFDYVWLRDRRLAILVADVAGKGVPAALLMSRLSAEARYCLMANPRDLSNAIQQLNVSMCDVVGERFVTLVACVLTPETNRVQIVCAGHEPPLVLRAGFHSFDARIDDGFIGPPLGILPGADFGVAEIHLKPGDNVLLFTDGVTDARDAYEREFGRERLLDLPRHTLLPANGSLSAESLIRAVVNKVNDHIGRHKQFDDITVVCFGRDPEETGASQVGTGEYSPAIR